MEKSVIYNLIETDYVFKLRKKIEAEDDLFVREINETKEMLYQRLDEETLKLVKRYANSIENRIDYVYYNINVRLLNLGIKIGMDLQEAFINEEEEN